jgi:hypothetical protein
LVSPPEATERGKCGQRAQRFPIEAPLRYRFGGQFAWTEGMTVNISRSGILFRAEKKIPSRTMLQMCIVFPTELTGYSPASIVCWGPVVRTVCARVSGSGPVLAAAIIKYRFIQEDSRDLFVNCEL